MNMDVLIFIILKKRNIFKCFTLRLGLSFVNVLSGIVGGVKY